MIKYLSIAAMVLTQWLVAAPLKMALFPNPLVDAVIINQDFLDRINRAGYTHILLHVEPPLSDVKSEWSNGVYLCAADPTKCKMKWNLTESFRKIGEWNKQKGANLKIVVHLGMGNKWAGMSYTGINPSIKVHTFKDYQGTAQAWKGFGLGFLANKTAIGDKCPQYTNSFEYDKTIFNHVKVVLQAYRDAYLSPSSSLAEQMDYIHLGFDENYTEHGNSYGLEKLEKLCFGNSYDDLVEINKQYFANQGISANFQICLDRWRTGTVPNPDDGKCTKWIATSDNNTVALAWRHKLLTDEIEQQINALKAISAEVSGNPLSGAKFMVWGDLWDPQKAGGYFGFSQFIGDLSTRFGQNLVMVPWQYSSYYQSPVEASVDVDIKSEWGTEIGGQIKGTFNTSGHFYDTKVALEAFTSKNLPTLFCGALRARSWKIDYSSVIQVCNYSTACKENPKCLGYVAGIFPKFGFDPAKNAYDQEAVYAILEMLPLVESRNMKGVRIGEPLGLVKVGPGLFRVPGLFQNKAQNAIQLPLQ
jgi:hypothetical protein